MVCLNSYKSESNMFVSVIKKHVTLKSSWHTFFHTIIVGVFGNGRCTDN